VLAHAHLLQGCTQDGTIWAAQAGVSTHRQHTTVLQALAGDKVAAALPPQAVGGQARHHHLRADSKAAGKGGCSVVGCAMLRNGSQASSPGAVATQYVHLAA
jgi:hypothetical protein